MIGKYDVVHIQLFAWVVKEDDSAPVVKNLMSILSKCKVTALFSGEISRKGRQEIAAWSPSSSNECG